MSASFEHGIYKKHRHFVRWVGLICVLFIGLGVVFVLKKTVNAPSDVAKSADIKKSEPKIVSVKGKYLFNGTIFWGRYFQDWSKKADGITDYNYPFSGLDSFDRAKYDGWAADLECPVTDKNVSSADQENLLTFNCRPEYVPAMSKYFNLIDLANNHSDNAGQEGLQQTRDILVKNNVQTFGHFDPNKKEDTCEVIALPVRAIKDDKTELKGQLPVAFCAWHYFYRLPTDGEIEIMDEYAKLMPVFAFIHMGQEYKTKADGIQESIAHQVADHGPEFVIANNPHWVQNTEVYKGKFIIYSTGNFIFDQQSNAEVTRSASPDITMTIAYDENVQKWLDLGQSCEKFKDSCLKIAKEMNLKKVQPKYTYEIVAGDSSKKLTKKADPLIQKAIEQRLNWQNISQLSSR